jgi:hypothetical protein
MLISHHIHKACSVSCESTSCRATSLGLNGAALALVCEDCFLTYCTYLFTGHSTHLSTNLRSIQFSCFT